MEACRRKYQHSSRALADTIKESLQGDRRRRATKLGSAVESLLTYDLSIIREAWIRMWGWYKEAVERPPPPSRVALATLTSEREELYRHVPLLGEPIPVEDPSFHL